MAEPLRTLVVDDEPAAVRRLARLCEAEPSLSLVATANGADAALEILDRTNVNLVLVDINMPGLNGLGLAAQIGARVRPPAIVFTTAHADFAVAAFAVDAVGYLTKPIDPIELATTVQRIGRRQSQSVAAAVWVPERGALVRLETATIDYMSGEDDYVRVHVGERSWLLAERLGSIAERFAGAFVRVHRSHLVNVAAIEAVRADRLGGWRVMLRSGITLPIGRSMLLKVRSHLGLNE